MPKVPKSQKTSTSGQIKLPTPPSKTSLQFKEKTVLNSPLSFGRLTSISQSSPQPETTRAGHTLANSKNRVPVVSAIDFIDDDKQGPH